MDDPRPTSDEGGTDDPGTPMDPQVQGQLPTAGAAHASHDMAGVAGAQAEGRPTSELAADVRAALHTLTAASFMEADVAAMLEDSLNGYASLDALVARVTDLEAEVEAKKQTIDAKNEELDAAEAQVAALTEDRDAAQRMADHMVTLKGDNAWAAANAERERAEAAEAALATTRQALTEIAAQMPDGTAARAVQAARRALADTEEPA